MDSIFGFLSTLVFWAIALAIALAVIIIPQYNKLKALAEGVSEAFSNILVLMQKRADLASKLQEIASTYAKDEQYTMLAVAKQDSVAGIVDAYKDSLEAVNIVNSVAQRYPELKSDVVYMRYMGDLTRIESELQQRREMLNASVRLYNSPLKQLPTVLYAPHVGLTEATYWQSDEPGELAKLKEFKTDDERVRALMAGAGQGVLKAGRGMADLTKQGVSAIKTSVENARSAEKKPADTAMVSTQTTHESQSESTARPTQQPAAE